MTKVTSSKSLDMQRVRAVLLAVEAADVRTKAAKIIQWDTQVREPWLLEMADPYSEIAADADPTSVALVLCHCGYNGRFAARRAVPQISYEPVKRTGVRLGLSQSITKLITNH